MYWSVMQDISVPNISSMFSSAALQSSTVTGSKLPFANEQRPTVSQNFLPQNPRPNLFLKPHQTLIPPNNKRPFHQVAILMQQL